jgi:uncharacterized membrane protein YtjA (UPF0391 family)
MLKWAIFFLVLSLVAGAVGLTSVSAIAKRISMVLFALLFLAFLGLLLFAWMISAAIAPERVSLFLTLFV